MRQYEINGHILDYYEDQDKIMISGRVTKDYQAVFLSNEEDPEEDPKPELYGFLEKSTNIIYDLNGGQSTVTNLNDIYV